MHQKSDKDEERNQNIVEENRNVYFEDAKKERERKVRECSEYPL
jgi:hypothetical protein